MVIARRSVPLLATALLMALTAPAALTQEIGDTLTAQDLRAAARIFDIEFTDAELEQLLERQRFFQDLYALRESYGRIRALAPDQSVLPALYFLPAEPAWTLPDRDTGATWTEAAAVQRPRRLEEVVFWPVSRLAELVRTHQVTSTELTRMYVERLKRYDPQLHAVVTLLEEDALAQAARADREIAAGRYRGPLHGIPYGLKDLFAVEGHPTTWGAAPYRTRTLPETATVARKLAEAGAVLVAKLSTGALAWGDVWFGGQTRNPWNLEEGSSGSSAGPAAAVSAGLVPFAVGTETWGSIVSPSARTGVTGLRPTFGRVSRAGGMAVSWSLDKVGPICREVEDCGMVLDAIRGADGIDRSAVDRPFNYKPGVDWSRLRIGYVAEDFEGEYPGASQDRETLATLRSLGAEPRPNRAAHSTHHRPHLHPGGRGRCVLRGIDSLRARRRAHPPDGRRMAQRGAYRPLHSRRRLHPGEPGSHPRGKGDA